MSGFVEATPGCPGHGGGIDPLLVRSRGLRQMQAAKGLTQMQVCQTIFRAEMALTQARSPTQLWGGIS